MKKKLCLLFALFAGAALSAQTHVSIPLEDEVYRLIDAAEKRGLCGEQSPVKPYTRDQVRAVLGEILASGDDRLSEKERGILREAAGRFEDAPRIRITADAAFSAGFYAGDGLKYGTRDWLSAALQADIGDWFSFGFNFGGGLLKVDREAYTYNAYYSTGENPNQDQKWMIDVYGDPPAYFPFSYRKSWDASVWNIRDINNSGQIGWPEGFSIGYSIKPELGGAVFDGRIRYRFGRLDREWGTAPEGNSLVLNRNAAPFVAAEATAVFSDWLSLSTLTGMLEYDPVLTGLGNWGFQNAFSISMMEVRYKNYFTMDFGSTAVWPKRFELMYFLPNPLAFLFQGASGDYDNVGAFLDLKGTWPGIGSLWASFFLDEATPEKDFFILDRMMYAYQAGISAPLPWLSFATAALSYTKIEPYCYTHQRIDVPWIVGQEGGRAVQEAYVNFGSPLGSYLPPNSDEIKARLDFMAGMKTALHLQYQMIRHGADHGSNAVDGSHLYSELAGNRSGDPMLRKYFLRDGAYQWFHIVKAGFRSRLGGPRPAFEIYGEAGFVISYYTNIEGPANSGSPSSYRIVDTPEYPHSKSVIAAVGIRVSL
ncbi:MAG: hypothetical protein LBU28_03815 [Spirochaetaceae bacterium]|jgi:hypothetical protein|nr:hypothetical protein [Spirochaetaceae bacterium]